jgi:hypothetical protein
MAAVVAAVGRVLPLPVLPLMVGVLVALRLMVWLVLYLGVVVEAVEQTPTTARLTQAVMAVAVL